MLARRGIGRRTVRPVPLYNLSSADELSEATTPSTVPSAVLRTHPRSDCAEEEGGGGDQL